MQKKPPVNPQPFVRLRIYRILVFQKHTVGISLKTADDAGETIPSPSGAYAFQRTRDEMRPSQLPDATESGSRHDRLWAVLRLNAARRSLTSLGDFLAEIFEVTK